MSDAFYKLGEFIGMSARHVHPDDFEFHKGAAEVVDTESFAPAGRLIANALYNIMEQGGRGNTAPAQHLKLLSKQANWHPQFMETIQCALESFIGEDTEMVKQAFIGSIFRGGRRILGLMPDVASKLLLGSAGIGGAAGALHWGLSRDIKEDNAELEVIKAQIAEYDRLAKQLEDSLRHKYQYGNQ